MGSVEYARPRKLRETLDGRLNLIRDVAECPATIDPDGTGLMVDRARSLLYKEVTAGGIDRTTAIWPLSLNQIERA